MQMSGLMNSLVCVVCRFVGFPVNLKLAEFIFGLSLIFLILDLAVSAWDIQISVKALNIQFSDLGRTIEERHNFFNQKVTQMNLTLIDQLILLALDDHKGNLIPDSTTFSYALAGALILELALEEKIEFSGEYVKVKDKSATGDAIRDQFLKIIEVSKKERKVRSWIDRIGQKSEQIKKETLVKLIDQRILEKREEKILWVFNVDKYPTQNPKPENQLRGRLYDIVINHHTPDLKEIMILNLIESCGLEREVFGKEHAKVFKKRMRGLKEDDQISGSVNKSIKEISEAINAMRIIVVATATATTTNIATGS
jgi:Golgi phosphoprotein 3